MFCVVQAASSLVNEASEIVLIIAIKSKKSIKASTKYVFIDGLKDIELNPLKDLFFDLRLFTSF